MFHWKNTLIIHTWERKKKRPLSRKEDETRRNPQKGAGKQRQEDKAEHNAQKMGDDEVGHQIHR